MRCFWNCFGRSYSRIYDSSDKSSHSEHTSKPLDPVRRVAQEIERLNLNEVAKSVEGKPRKDRINAYIDYYHRLKSQAEQFINDFKSSEHPEVEMLKYRYKNIKVDIEKKKERVLEDAMKKRNSLFHRHATFPRARRKNSEYELKNSIGKLNVWHEMWVNAMQELNAIDKLANDGINKKSIKAFYDLERSIDELSNMIRHVMISFECSTLVGI